MHTEMGPQQWDASAHQFIAECLEDACVVLVSQRLADNPLEGRFEV
ncbi:hypothetical protein N9H39_01330 [Gammaproteobacteria bacterium]|nr:hypothetical protein [Gammaproteobacteria bacterium]